MDGGRGGWKGCLTASVVSGHDRLVLSDSVGVRLHDSTQERCVQVGQIIRVAVARCRDARVDTRSVAVPEVHVDSRNGLARASVDELDVKVEGNTLLAVRDVAANELAVDVVGALGHLRLQDACRIVLEQKSLIVAVADAGGRLVRDIVSRKVTTDKRAVQTSLDSGLLGDCLATSERSLREASALKLRSTRADGVGAPLHEGCALSGLLGQVVARVCESRRQCKETKGQQRRDWSHGR